MENGYQQIKDWLIELDFLNLDIANNTEDQVKVRKTLENIMSVCAIQLYGGF